MDFRMHGATIRRGNMFEIILNISSCNFEVFSAYILEFLFAIAV
jgi:hypothetical protein